MNVIKLGGSIITEKDSYKKVNLSLIRKLCEVLSDDKGRKILIHGAGSFGHIVALRSGLEKPGSINRRENVISRVMSDVLSLDSVIVDELNEKGVRAVSVPPHIVYHGNEPDFRMVDLLLKKKFVPVLYGDIVLAGDKYRIVSGDEIALDLAKAFRPDSVVFATDVDGLFDSDPKTNSDARLIPIIKSREISLVDTRKDATGSMAGKMERIKKMVRYTSKVVVLNGTMPERLRSQLRGKETISTVIT